MKTRTKQIFLILNMLIMHTFSYGSAALVQRSQPALQIATNNLINTTGSSIASMGAQSIPMTTNSSSLSPVAAENINTGLMNLSIKIKTK